MNLPSERFQVGVQKYECHQFEQLLDDCLDDRDSISALAANPHLQQCGECQNAYEVYLQFDSSGGTVLNGGARFKNRSVKPQRESADFWSVIGAAVLTTSAAVLLLLVFASSSEQSDSNFVASNVDLHNVLGPFPIGLMEAKNSNADMEPSELPRWDASYISEFPSAVGYQAQPTLDKLYEASEVSGNLVASRLAIPFQQVKLLPSIGSPWQYTSELPGIRPIHRSMKVGLALCQDSVSLL